MPVGRPAGLGKSGGRRKGTPNRATKAKAAKIAESGLTPLDYMLSVLRNEKAPSEDRMEAAKSAAPYVHPKLAAMTHAHSGALGVYDATKLSSLSDEELKLFESVLARIAPGAASSVGGQGGDSET